MAPGAPAVAFTAATTNDAMSGVSMTPMSLPPSGFSGVGGVAS